MFSQPARRTLTPKEADMRFYRPCTAFYCGVDLHAKSMYLCVLDRQGSTLLHRNLPTDALAPYRPDVVVACECLDSWYWLADLCAAEGLAFALGHALAMRAIHGGKTKSDKIDSEKIARLTLGGLLPLAHAYPADRRGLRDLLRRRLRLVRLRAELYAHVKTLNRQANLPPLGREARCAGRRAELPQRFGDAAVRQSAAADLELVGHYDALIAGLEEHLLRAAWERHAPQLTALQSIPGVGAILSLTILYEVDDIARFDTRQQFASYSRLVAPRQESAGKLYGVAGRKQGNAYLKWAFSEAAVSAAQHSPRIGAYLARLASRHGAGKAKSLLAHKLGRAVYHLLKGGAVFDEERFLRS
jgi:transposase